MLQRAASNAYSWWWASHIRTKQSKWIEQNLQDMEEKVKYVLQIVDEDGDSFSMRAEMYYRKRPELINFVEESYRAYRALAERYNHMSRDLQNANHTIATVFPEQVQFAMDHDVENLPETSTPSRDTNNPSKVLPAVPKTYFPKLPTLTRNFTKSFSRKGQLNKAAAAAKAAIVSGLTKTEALEEIDKLQKKILAMQTEKEFIKTSYESRLVKYWEIEKQITEMQGKVSSLQDEFGIGTVIEDHEARTLMADTALKSCQDTLSQLQEKEEQSAEEARAEYQKIKEAREKLKTLRDEFLGKIKGQHELLKVYESVHNIPKLENLDQEVSSMEWEKHDLELLRQKIKEQFELDSTSHNMIELAEKIDDLVNKVISLETVVSSQTALVKRLRSETGELQEHIHSLEVDKESLIESSDHMSDKLRELEDELLRFKELNQRVEDQNHNLQRQFAEATCNLDHLSDKLQNVRPDEVDNEALFQEASSFTDPKLEKELFGHGDVATPCNGSLNLNKVKIEDQEAKDDATDLRSSVKIEEKENIFQSKPFNCLNVVSEQCQDARREDREKKDDAAVLSSSVTTEEKILVQSNLHSDMNIVSEICQEQEGEEDGKQDFSLALTKDRASEPQELEVLKEDLPRWGQLLNGLEDREKFLLEEYTVILRNYKEVKKKLGEVEKKNQDILFESEMQIRELNDVNSLKDEEIQSLRQKLSASQAKPDENLDTRLTEFHLQQEWPQESTGEGASFQVYDISSLTANKGLLNISNEPIVESTERTVNSGSSGNTRVSPMEDEENEIKEIHVEESQDVSTIEEKFRSNIDSLLEENLEFWLRFSTSFHQIQKFESSIHDLQVEVSKLKEDGSTKLQSLKSDAQPIYNHLREIQTELALWLEQNAILNDELQSRLSSLCSIQEEISRQSNAAGSKADETQLNRYQAAKFQGEVLNMKQENNKVADELQAGFDHVRGLQVEIKKTLSKLDDEFGISASKNHSFNIKNSLHRSSRVPLRSFLFGVKLKKQKPSIFSCINPVLQKQYSDLASGLHT